MGVRVVRWGKRPPAGAPDDRPWAVVVRRNGRRRIRKLGRTEADRERAEDLAAAIREQLAAQAMGLPGRALPMPVDQVLNDWLSVYGRTLASSTEETAKGLVDHWLIPHFTDVDVRDLTDPHLLEFVARVQERGRSLALARNALSVLRRACSVAVRAGKLERNPCTGIAKLLAGIENRAADEVKTRDSWTEREVEILLSITAARERRFLPYVVAAFDTGARRGELIGWQWPDVDWHRQRIHVRRRLRYGDSGKPKTRRDRFAPMSPRLARLLLELRGSPSTTGPIFRSRNGTPVTEKTVHRAWDRILDAAARLGVRRLPLHCARHTYATLSLSAGRSPLEVARELGHSPEVLLRVYAHALPASDAPDWSWMPGAGDARRHSSVTTTDTEELSDLAQVSGIIGDPGAIRTRDPQLRRIRGGSSESVAGSATSGRHVGVTGDAKTSYKDGDVS